MLRQQNRREFMLGTVGFALAMATVGGRAAPSRHRWHERRDLFPEGVASGDPQPDSIILWTRRPFAGNEVRTLTIEVAEDRTFERVVSATRVHVGPDLDWTCRVLVEGLQANGEYWYRFIDEDGNGSRIGRALTAPEATDPRPVIFAFVSCQSVNEGTLNAYRKMIYEDKQKHLDDQIRFVLHLGDFIYEVVQYPEEVPSRYDRKIFDIGRIPDGRKVQNFHVPTTLDGYRYVYRAHLRDPDLQDARARFPFVPVWDNHEFSWRGWQSSVKYGDEAEPAQTLRVSANQAWFEYQPARVRPASGLNNFKTPDVKNAPAIELDDDGLAVDSNSIAAIGSLTVYRSFRYGKNIEMILTDQHSYRMEEQTGKKEAAPLIPSEFADFYPQEVMEIIDGGKSFANNNPPEVISVGDESIPNFRKSKPPYTILGRVQREWFKTQLRSSTATWKIWGSSGGTLDWRADPQNLPPGLTEPWPGSGYAGFGGGDFSTSYTERSEIYDVIRDEGITGFVTVSGDRHSFWAGYAAKQLPPKEFQPLGVAFVTGSLSAPGLVEAVEHVFPKDHPLRPLYLADRTGEEKPAPTINLTLKRGVKSALEYAKSGDIAKARAETNPELSPHLTFVDMAGHGYTTMRVTSEAVSAEFVCIPRPVERSNRDDGGALRYRVQHEAKLWLPGQLPILSQLIIEGAPDLSV